METKQMTYTQFHEGSLLAKDVDPAILCLNYIADRYELNIEQRYWLAFLYCTCYCSPTVFYIYNEFPDFECVNEKRLQRWWDNNKNKTVFQTDRLRIKTQNLFVETFSSYRKCVGKLTQEEYFSQGNIEQKILNIKNVGRFSLFNYMDTLHQITPTKKEPVFDIFQAESCLNGLLFATGRQDWIDKKIGAKEKSIIETSFRRVLRENTGNIFQIETTLCSYKKYRLGTRYIGFYIERMRKEIEQLQSKVKDGVYWEVLWEFRKESFEPKFLLENNR